MVNNKDFGKRIQKIMDHYAVSASSFADYMGVGRSSISHILSGRNKPSLDFVMKIVDAYTDVELQWLLYGKGTFPKSDNAVIEEKKITEEPAVISKPTSAPILASAQDLFSQSSPDKEIKQSPVSSLDKKSNPSYANHEIDRIVVFYSDGSFQSYQMKKS